MKEMSIDNDNVELKVLEIYTDGACKGNPGKGGWGMVVYEDGNEIFTSHGGLESTTNNQMELTGFLQGLKWVGTLSGQVKVTIFSDSQYTLKGLIKNVSGEDVTSSGVNGWICGWKKRGWKNVKNIGLWKDIENELIRILQTFSVTNSKLILKYVKGHSGNLGNDRADELSNIF